jgi:hypothetical protein
VAIIIECPCGKNLRIGDEHAGQQGRCPVCSRVLDIPAADTPHPLAAPTPPDGTGQAVTATPALAGPAGAATAGSPGSEQVPSATPRLEVVEAPPGSGSTDAPPPPGYKLHSPGHVALATFFSNVLGGAVILALNYRALGQTRAAWRAALCGLIAVTGLLVLLLLLPDKAATAVGLASALVSIIGMYQLAKALQGAAYDRHIRGGGKQGSGAAACGIGLLCGAVTVAVAVGCGVAQNALFDEGMGRKVVFAAQEEVYYTEGVTEAQARALGRALQQAGYLNGSGGKTVQVSKGGDGFIVAFVLQEGSWDKPGVSEEFRELGRQLSRQALGGQRLEIRLCDMWMDTKKTIDVRPDPFPNQGRHDDPMRD